VSPEIKLWQWREIVDLINVVKVNVGDFFYSRFFIFFYANIVLLFTQRLDGTIRGDIRKQAMDHFNAEGSTVCNKLLFYVCVCVYI